MHHQHPKNLNEKPASASSKAVWVKAEDLRAGDWIVEIQPEGWGSADRVSEVRFVTEGRVHIDLNEWTGVSIRNEGERVRVLLPRP